MVYVVNEIGTVHPMRAWQNSMNLPRKCKKTLIKPEGGVEAMTGQSTLTLARSEENEELYAGSPQSLLQPKAADAASEVAWEQLVS